MGKEGSMIALEEAAPAILPATIQPRRCNLTLHCGAASVPRNALLEVPIPPQTRSWVPLGHSEVLWQVENQILRNGLKIVEEAHALTHDGNRYFGMLQTVLHGKDHQDYSWIVGIRNSHDKRFPAGLVAGAQVFVCDNLAFSGEIKFGRKHTRFIRRDLPNLVNEAIEKLLCEWRSWEVRTEMYKEKKVPDWKAHDLAIQAIDREILPVTLLPRMLQEWRQPTYEDFSPRNTWSLFNAFTEVLKGNLTMLPNRTEKLCRLLDEQQLGRR
jgi:hypothetical protein